MGNEQNIVYKEKKIKQKENKENPNPQGFYNSNTKNFEGNILEKSHNQFSVKKEKANIESIQGSLKEDIRKIYTFKDILGDGHFGSVRSAYKKEIPDKLYAIKSIKTKNISKEDLSDLMREVEVISSLNHPNIIKFYESYYDNHYFHIVMELCTGTELFKYIIKDKRISEQIVSKIIYKLLIAIAYCHSKGVTHRDIKPENILVENKDDKTEVKLIDFGFSRKYDSNEKMHTILGTPFYIAPEVLKGAYDEKCDVWSIGVLTYILLCGEPPFNAKSNGEIFKKILYSNISFPKNKWNKVSNDAISFIKKCLQKEPKKRYSSTQAISDPWFKNILTHNNEYLCSDILENLKNFTKPEKFKTLVLNYIANNVSEEELNKLKNAFIAIDRNHSGKISKDELEIAFKNTGFNVSKDELDSIMNSAELTNNTDGKIEYDEFIVACMNQKNNIKKEKLEEAFKYFDVDDSGYIDKSDIKNTLIRSGQKIINENDIDNIINEICQQQGNNEGKISFDEFLKMFGVK